MNFLFVGERPSLTAARIGATWQNGKLAGKTLRAALLACGINPDQQEYVNLWTGPTPHNLDELDERLVVFRLDHWHFVKGWTIVALGELVHKRLTFHKIPHIQLVHPAARGAIRKTERYQAHVAAVLLAR